ncbi:DUF1345 domain-containing protein, partial [Phenylobacterium aquaticum]
MTTRAQRSRLQRAWRMLSSRPHLTAATLAGLVAWIGLAAAPDVFGWSTHSILAWDVGGVWFIVSMLLFMRGKSVEDMRATVARQDEGQGMILGIVLAASIASLGSIAVELGLAKGATGWMLAFRTSLAMATVAISWFVVQLIFALHYGHEYYRRGGGSGCDAGGLNFPGGEEPDYWDLVHFAVVVGVAAQTADVAFTSKTQRRIGTT